MYNEEELESSLDLMVKRGFPVGRFVYDSAAIYNALISTVEDGPFWYGDLTFDDATKLKAVSVELNRTLHIDSLTGSQRFSISPTD
jgi:hypothetical protein